MRYPNLLLVFLILTVVPGAMAASISQSAAMPVVNQAVTLTVSQDLIGNNITVTGTLGVTQLVPDAQGQATWTPTRYGQYVLTCGTATNTVWVTVKPMIFHWWQPDAAVQNATIVMNGTSSYWHARGVTNVSWVGGEYLSRPADGGYTTAQQWFNNWSYAQTSDGIAVDEMNADGGAATGGTTTDQITQAVSMIPQQWGTNQWGGGTPPWGGSNYSLGIYISDSSGNGWGPDAADLKALNAYFLIEDYYGGYSLHVSRWQGVTQYGLQNQSVLTLSPYFYISSSAEGPQTEADVREQFREVRLAAPQAPGIALFNAYGTGLDAACDQAIHDYFLEPVINFSVNASGQLVVWNIGNEIAAGFTLQFLDSGNNVLQSIDLSSLAPNAQMTLTQPSGAVTAYLINPAGTVNLYPNGTYTIPPPPGCYIYTDANGDGLWSTFSDWNPQGPPPGNIDSGNYAYFSGNGIAVKAASGETSINSVQFASAGWSITGNAASQDFFTYSISSAGSGTNTINTGYRTTAGVPATFNISGGNTLAVYGLISGAGGLYKQGVGTLALNYANTFAGAATISAGTLQLGDGVSNNGSVAGGITNNASLVFANPAAQTYSGVISGTGAMVEAGPGALTLTASNTYGGGTIVTSGSLKLDLSSYTGNIGFQMGAYSVGSGGTLNFYNTNTVADNLMCRGATFSGSGAIVKTGGGFLTLHTGCNLTAFGGALNVQAGTLALNNLGSNGIAPAMTVNIAAGAYLDARYNVNVGMDQLTGAGTLTDSSGATATVSVGDNNGTSTFAGVIQNPSGAISLVKNGTGALTLTGSNTYTGSTTVNSGTLSVAGSIRSSTVTVNNGGTLVATGTTGGVTVNSGGSFAPGIGGTGSLNLGNHPLSLAGAASMAINASSGTNSSVQGITTLTYGGTLAVTNLAGSFAAGNTFTLFHSGTYQGAFSSVVLPALPNTLQWNISNLGVTGAIGVVQSPWGQWLSQNFTPSQQASPAISGDTATPNGDGTPNLLKYATGMGAWTVTPPPVTEDIETVNGNNYLRLTVSKNPSATDISYIVEVTGDLPSGNWSSAETTVEVNTATTLVVRDNTPMSSASRRFIHLKVAH